MCRQNIWKTKGQNSNIPQTANTSNGSKQSSGASVENELLSKFGVISLSQPQQPQTQQQSQESTHDDAHPNITTSKPNADDANSSSTPSNNNGNGQQPHPPKARNKKHRQRNQQAANAQASASGSPPRSAQLDNNEGIVIKQLLCTRSATQQFSSVRQKILFLILHPICRSVTQRRPLRR